MSVKIRRLHEDAVIPTYAKPGDSGFDLVAIEDVIVEPGQTVKVGTGLAFEIPEGFELQVRPRSGITLRTPLRVQLGTIDAGYRGEVAVIVDNLAPKEYYGVGSYLGLTGEAHTDIDGYEGYCDTYIIRKGDRIAQGVLMPVAHAKFEEVDMLGETERGANGFGHSGVNTRRSGE